MVALHRSGRRGEALAAYRRARRRIVEELGLEPGEGLRALERAILRGDDPSTLRWPAGAGAPSAPAPAAAPGRPALLPSRVAGFVGRRKHLAWLDSALQRDPTCAVISVITGIGGVGKTALAVEWAHRVAPAFPDGQLHIDLHGWSDGSPTSPLEALAFLLRALGMPGEQIPIDVEAAAAAYRSTLAGRRLLVLLDNAAAAEQVRPLLPGSGSSVVVVTSRNRLTGLLASHSAKRLDLGELTVDEALELLAGAVGPARVDAELSAAHRLVDLCGRLPLAVRIAGAELAGQSDASIDEHADALVADRFGSLAVPGDPHVAVEAAFDLSYCRLGSAERRMFRLLGLAPGVDVTPPAVAELTGLNLPTARHLLRRLVTVHLVDQHVTGRYAMHDLLRLYAAERSRREDTAGERDQAAGRLHRWYAGRASAAAVLISPDFPRLTTDEADAGAAPFADPAEALGWLEAERHNLVAAVTPATSGTHAGHAITLANALRSYFSMRRYSVDLVQIGHGLRAAAGDDPLGLAVAELALTSAEHTQGRIHQAIDHHETALAWASKAGWDAGVANVLSTLGLMHWELGRLDRASQCLAAALDVEQRVGGRAAQARLTMRLAFIDFDRGAYERAETRLRQALAISDEIAHPMGRALCHGSLGYTLHALGALDAALEHAATALALARAGNSRLGEASALDCLATIDRDANRLESALTYANDATALADQPGAERFVADSANTRGTIYTRLGRHTEALADHQYALEVARRAGSITAEIQAHLGLAAALMADGRPSFALGHAERARAEAAAGGFDGLYGQALTAQARAHLAVGDRASALEAARNAASVHRRAGRRIDLLQTEQLLADA
jgi:tetratricopeptide (TPR) repeat protein